MIPWEWLELNGGNMNVPAATLARHSTGNHNVGGKGLGHQIKGIGKAVHLRAAESAVHHMGDQTIGQQA